MSLRGQRMGHHRDETYSKESFLPDKPTSWLKYYKAPSRLKKKTATTTTTTTKTGTNIPSEISTFIQPSNDISQKPWVWESCREAVRQLLKNRETHGGIVRDGRYANISRQTANVTLHLSYAGWLREGSFEWMSPEMLISCCKILHTLYILPEVDIKNLWEFKKKGVINWVKGNKIPWKETGNFTKVRVNEDFCPGFGKIRLVWV